MIATAYVMTGCASINVNKNHDYQGKIWSAVIVRPLIDGSKDTGAGSEFNKRTNFNVPRDQELRATYVHFSSGYTSIMMVVGLPHNIEYADIPKRSLVEVMIENSLDVNFNEQRYSRVLRVICVLICIEN